MTCNMCRLTCHLCRLLRSSGAEDKHAYLWDRHHAVCLSRYPHQDVVNAVAFNPADPGMMVTVSDDRTIKVSGSALGPRGRGVGSGGGRRRGRGLGQTRWNRGDWGTGGG